MNQWGLCFAPALIILALGELFKLIAYGAHGGHEAAAAEGAAA
jgi:hypothetical protein